MADIKLKPISAGWLLFIIYLVGVCGFLLPQTRELMQRIIWITLSITAIILLCYHKKWNKEFIFSILLIAFSGFLIEVLGVRTGYIFGHYQYGPTLGFAYWDTPLMMMVTWLTTIYITRQIAEMIAKDPLLISILAALLMVLLDYFIEPFAMHHAMWQWNSGKVPFHNYIGWFISGLLIQYMFQKAVKYPPNKLALPVYLIQLGFFMSLYFTSL